MAIEAEKTFAEILGLPVQDSELLRKIKALVGNTDPAQCLRQ